MEAAAGARLLGEVEETSLEEVSAKFGNMEIPGLVTSTTEGSLHSPSTINLHITEVDSGHLHYDCSCDRSQGFG